MTEFHFIVRKVMLVAQCLANVWRLMNTLVASCEVEKSRSMLIGWKYKPGLWMANERYDQWCHDGLVSRSPQHNTSLTYRGASPKRRFSGYADHTNSKVHSASSLQRNVRWNNVILHFLFATLVVCYKKMVLFGPLYMSVCRCFAHLRLMSEHSCNVARA